MSNTKRCYKCKRMLPTSSFYKNRAKRDGFASPCKQCAKAVSKRWRQDNPEKQAERTKRWRQDNPNRSKQHWQKWARENREKASANQKRYADKNPNKIAAHQKVRNAIRNGELSHPSYCSCNKCTNQADHYHHPDYDQQLFVVPVCGTCHVEIHNNEKKEKQP